jgi:hypothetical protein
MGIPSASLPAWPPLNGASTVMYANQLCDCSAKGSSSQLKCAVMKGFCVNWNVHFMAYSDVLDSRVSSRDKREASCDLAGKRGLIRHRRLQPRCSTGIPSGL